MERNKPFAAGKIGSGDASGNRADATESNLVPLHLNLVPLLLNLGPLYWLLQLRFHYFEEYDKRFLAHNPPNKVISPAGNRIAVPLPRIVSKMSQNCLAQISPLRLLHPPSWRSYVELGRVAACCDRMESRRLGGALGQRASRPLHGP